MTTAEPVWPSGFTEVIYFQVTKKKSMQDAEYC